MLKNSHIIGGWFIAYLLFYLLFYTLLSTFPLFHGKAVIYTCDIYRTLTPPIIVVSRSVYFTYDKIVNVSLAQQPCCAIVSYFFIYCLIAALSPLPERMYLISSNFRLRPKIALREQAVDITPRA